MAFLQQQQLDPYQPKVVYNSTCSQLKQIMISSGYLCLSLSAQTACTMETALAAMSSLPALSDVCDLPQCANSLEASVLDTFDVIKVNSNLDPSAAHPVWWSPVHTASAEAATNQLTSLARNVCTALAVGLSLHCRTFTDLLDDVCLQAGTPGSSHLQYTQYTEEHGTAESAQRHEHIDRTMLTVIYSKEPGLEVTSPGSRTWLPAPHGRDHVVVLPGWMIEMASSNLIVAAPHRVVQGSHRTLVLKLQARGDAVVQPIHGYRNHWLPPTFGLMSPNVLPDTVSNLLQLFEDNVAHSITVARQAANMPVYDPVQAGPGAVPVCVTRLGGKPITVLVYLDHRRTLAGELKASVHALEGLPRCQMRLIAAGRQLFDEEALVDCGVEEGSTIHLVLLLRGD